MRGGAAVRSKRGGVHRAETYRHQCGVFLLLSLLICAAITACRPAANDSLPEQVVSTYLEAQKSESYVINLAIEQVTVSNEETARTIKRYTGSELAAKNGWTDAYLSENMVAVYAKYTVDYDNTKVPYNEGRLEQYFYMTRANGESEWTIWDTSTPSDIP